MTAYCVTTKHPDPNAPKHLRILATRRAFLTLDDARKYAATVDSSHDPAVSAWFGDTEDENPASLHPEDKPRTLLTYNMGTLPVLRAALVLCLPEHAAGCAPEHRAFLDTAARILGTGLPLSCLLGEDPYHNHDGEPAWEYIESDPAEQVYAVTVRAVVKRYNIHDETPDGHPINDEETEAAWACDTSATDDGETFPAVLLCYTEEIEEAAAEIHGDPDDYEEGDEVCVYVPVSDDGEILTITDDEDEAADQIRERRGESRYGYPWAWGWAYHIDSSDARYHADVIQRAGYVMATQTATGETFAGVDGGGYDFDSAHRAPLGAYLLAKRGQRVTVATPDTDPDPEAIPVGPMVK